MQQAQAQKTALEATVRGAEITLRRASDLQSKAVGTVASLDNATVALDQAKANLAGADANIAAANANIAVLTAQRAEAESTIRSLELARDKAERDLGFTVLKAPYDGVVGNLRRSGRRPRLCRPAAGGARSGRPALYRRQFQGNADRPHGPGLEGQHPRRCLRRGRRSSAPSQSISPASGSVFSLLPAENATGNFTKVIQRVPVRIVFPKDVLDSGRSACRPERRRRCRYPHRAAAANVAAVK